MATVTFRADLAVGSNITGGTGVHRQTARLRELKLPSGGSRDLPLVAAGKVEQRPPSLMPALNFT